MYHVRKLFNKVYCIEQNLLFTHLKTCFFRFLNMFLTFLEKVYGKNRVFSYMFQSFAEIIGFELYSSDTIVTRKTS
jgi:hypothetical protein